MKPISVLIGIAAAAICFHSAAQAQKKPKAPLPTGLYAIFETSAGTITAKLDEKYAPKSVENFVELAQGTKAWAEPDTNAMVKRPMYNNITFHRVLRGMMIQSGDPTGTGSHNCGFSIPDEIMPGVLFDRPGKLAVANTGKPNSGGCQFFITADLVPMWNGKYTIFGQVVRGQDVVNAIARAPLRDYRPVDPAKLISVTIDRVGPEPGKKSKP